jgi:DNA-binding transcriptional MocR family regulator
MKTVNAVLCSRLRLSYGMISDEETEEGAQRLGRAIHMVRPH